jgi:hypothetical protein
VSGIFIIGEKVKKIGGQYGGPGVVKAVITVSGSLRYVVAHRIQDGWGELLHIYSENQLEAT